MPLADSKLLYAELEEVVNRWFHNPDPITFRAALAVPAALNLEQSSTWLMIVGPSSSGKTSLHFPMLKAYAKTKETSNVNVPGLLSLAKGHRGEGVLANLGVKGLWLIKDMGSIISMREDKRNEFLASMREIYDGSWTRDSGKGNESWVGNINVVAASTRAIERAYRVNQELGERFIYIRTRRPEGQPLRRKAARQAGQKGKMTSELQAIAKRLLHNMTPAKNFSISEEWEARTFDAAEFVAQARTGIVHDGKRSIVDVLDIEGAPRLYQEMLAILAGDAALHGQNTIDETQFPLLKRLSFDTIPLARGRILEALSDAQTSLRRHDLKEVVGMPWERTYKATLDDLRGGLGIISETKQERETSYTLSKKMRELARAFLP